jgi:hypothetical protein
MLVKTKLHQVYNGNFDITRMLDQSNLSVQRCRLIFWVECSVGGYLALAKTIKTKRHMTGPDANLTKKYRGLLRV